MSINRTRNTVRSHYTWRTNDGFETYETETRTSKDRGRDEKSGLGTTLVSRP